MRVLPRFHHAPNTSMLGSLLLLLLLQVVAQRVDAQGLFDLASLTCSQAGQDRCAETNQVCGVQQSDDAEICFACQLGFVRFNETTPCVEIANLTMDDFFDAFPEWIGNRDVSLVERLVRLRIAATIVSEINAENKPYLLALNELSAETEDEERKRNGFRAAAAEDDDLPEQFTATTATEGLPAAIDWVEEGVVSIVKNQASCGCCWSVAAVGALEAKYNIDMNARNESSQINFSFQQFISCDDSNSGCDGGLTTRALQYAHDNSFGGVTRWIEYPYTDRDGTTTTTCRLSDQSVYRPPEARMVVEMRDRKASFTDRLQRMKQGLAEQPVAIAIKASCATLNLYRRGVLTEDGDCACDEPGCLDHAVLMVGYNDTHDPPYFLIKNSWGTNWGEDGYFKVAQTAKGDYGLFGVLAEGVFPSTNAEFKEVDDGLEVWQIILIIVGSALVLSGVVYFVWECFATMKREPESTDQ